MVYLVRHGESTANLNKRFSGITDVELSSLGKKQALVAGLNLKECNVSKIYSSPLIRAFDTAKIISKEIDYDINTIDIVDNLIEVNFGIFENMTWDEMIVDYKEETDQWIKDGNRYRFPKGESYEDIIQRIAQFMDKVSDDSVIVTHFGVIQSILLYYKITDYTNLWKFNISNCDIVVIKDQKFERIIKCEI